MKLTLTLGAKYNINLIGEPSDIQKCLADCADWNWLKDDENGKLEFSDLTIETLTDIIENKLDPYYPFGSFWRYPELMEKEFNIKIEWEE